MANSITPRPSLFPQDEIDDPAPTNVRSRPAAVVQYGRFLAPGVLERVREDRHRAEVARLVHLTRQRHRGVRSPRRGEPDRPKRIAEDVAEYDRLFGTVPTQAPSKVFVVPVHVRCKLRLFCL